MTLEEPSLTKRKSTDLRKDKNKDKASMDPAALPPKPPVIDLDVA